MLEKNVMFFNKLQAVQKKSGEFDVIAVPLTVEILKTLESFIVQVQERQIELLEMPEHLDIQQLEMWL